MVTTYLLGLIFSALVLLSVVLGIRNAGMRERYALWWIIIAGGMVLVSIYPHILDWFARLLGIVVPLNLGLFVAAIVLLFMILQLSVDLSTLYEERRKLAEEITLQAEELRSLAGRLHSLEHPAQQNNAEDSHR
ncbi:DUF2304 domain-containing protein [Schaalia sp. ZJ405]|uniref:DUF2304 domain-containing protein n=1 Tax=unclassified Schaalia TaxID=2691889 RepID=UPI0013EB4A3B|nr:MULTISPECIES: DUF2304 domain-containing protein [unclassified Schaalia]QPK81713.1 DUF2304 domain-containing protein [Schaalia sp. ZJ405]